MRTRVVDREASRVERRTFCFLRWIVSTVDSRLSPANFIFKCACTAAMVDVGSGIQSLGGEQLSNLFKLFTFAEHIRDTR